MTDLRDATEVALADLLSLRGRAAVVTGGAQGLGKAIARRFAEAGASVVIGDRNLAQAEAAAAELAGRYGADVIAVPLDVADEASVHACAGTCVERFGAIDIWVNNAGVFPALPIGHMRLADWEQVCAVKARGTFLGAQAASRAMAGSGGVIVNVASLAGIKGIAPALSAYVSSKHAVVGLTRQLAIELAPQRIRVLAIAPSFVVTEGNLALMQGNEQVTKAAAEDIPSMFQSKLGRVGVPDDIARVALFCASDMALFMTGTTLVVDAGESA